MYIPTKRTPKSHTYCTHTLTHMPPHYPYAYLHHPNELQFILSSPLYTHVYTVYLDNRHKYCRVAGVYMYIHVKLLSVRKHIRSVCNFLLISDITERLMAHCRTVPGHLDLRNCTLIDTGVTHRWIPSYLVP